MNIPQSSVKVWAYSRISQHDPDHDLPLEEIISVRGQTCLRLAQQNDLTLPPDNILFETVSGARIDNRPQILLILDLCARGEITHLITPEQSRILRGDKRDEAVIEEAFIAVGLILITMDGVTDFGAEDYDPLPFEVRALVARYERLRTSKRRKEANKSRLQQNKRSVGRPPYGYFKPVLPSRPPDENDQVNGLAGINAQGALEWFTYLPIPVEFEIVRDVFQTYLRGNSVNSIRTDLNARNIPPPGNKRPYSNQTNIWWFGTLRNILLNPLYAGYHARVTRIIPGKGHVWAKPSQYVLAPVMGHWPTIITLAQWYQIRDRLSMHEFADRNDLALLTQILFCERGESMHKNSSLSYGCHCAELGYKHGGAAIRMRRIHLYIDDLIISILEQIPSDALKPRPSRRNSQSQKRDRYEQDYISLQNRLQSATEEREDLMRHRSNHIKWFGLEAWEKTCQKVSREIEECQTESDRIRSILTEPDYMEILPILQEIRKHGISVIWSAAPTHLKRRIIHALIEKIQLLPISEDQHKHRDLTVIIRPEWYSYVKILPQFNIR